MNLITFLHTQCHQLIIIISIVSINIIVMVIRVTAWLVNCQRQDWKRRRFSIIF